MDILYFLSFLLSPALQDQLLFARIVLGAIAAALLGFIVWAFFNTSWFQYAFFTDLREFFTFRSYGLRKMTQMWQKTQARLETAQEAEYKLAVIEADSMLDEALKRMSFPGATVDERLQNLSAAIVANVEEVQQAHALRNNVVHDPNFRLSLDEARKTLSVFEKAFQSLDLI
jgi:uncharacterized membrane protein YraQ (UPF0718 family)